MKYGEITRGQDEAMTNALGGYEKFTKVLRGELVVRLEEVAPDQFVLDLNYDVYPNPEEMFSTLLASGAYNWTNPDLTFEHFPIEKRSGIWRVICELAHPNIMHSTEFARGFIHGRGCQTPHIEYGLAFGAAHKDLQRKHPIPVACKPWVNRHGNEILPVLSGNAG